MLAGAQCPVAAMMRLCLAITALLLVPANARNVQIKIKNRVDDVLELWWVTTTTGEEGVQQKKIFQSNIYGQVSANISSYPGHVFYILEPGEEGQNEQHPEQVLEMLGDCSAPVSFTVPDVDSVVTVVRSSSCEHGAAALCPLEITISNIYTEVEDSLRAACPEAVVDECMLKTASQEVIKRSEEKKEESAGWLSPLMLKEGLSEVLIELGRIGASWDFSDPGILSFLDKMSLNALGTDRALLETVYFTSRIGNLEIPSTPVKDPIHAGDTLVWSIVNAAWSKGDASAWVEGLPLTWKAFLEQPEQSDLAAAFHFGVRLILYCKSLPFNPDVAEIIVLPLLTEEEADWIRDVVDDKGLFTLGRHDNYPTNDMVLRSIPELAEFWDGVMEERMQPFSKSQFGGPIRETETFVARYVYEIQRDLKEHFDDNNISFVLNLSTPEEDYQGGGTFYRILDEVIKPPKGHMVLHPARLWHAGHPIQGGRRYVVVGLNNITELKDAPWRLWGKFSSSARVVHRSLPDDV